MTMQGDDEARGRASLKGCRRGDGVVAGQGRPMRPRDQAGGGAFRTGLSVSNMKSKFLENFLVAVSNLRLGKPSVSGEEWWPPRPRG